MDPVSKLIDTFIDSKRERKELEITRKQLIDYVLPNAMRETPDITPSTTLSLIDKYIRRARETQDLGRLAPGKYVIGLAEDLEAYELPDAFTVDPRISSARELTEFVRANLIHLPIRAEEFAFRSIADMAKSSSFLVVSDWKEADELSRYEGLSL